MATAGQGARQQQITAQRRVEEAERQLAAARAAEHAWSTGAAGEEQVAAALAGLQQFGWVLLHDVAWPGRPRANLDHVLVGPGGVLIVDTKNWSGTVTVDATRGLRCNGYRKTKEVAAVEAARQAVLPLVPTIAPTLVTGLICLAAQDQEALRLAGGTSETGGIVVVGRAQLLQHVLDLPVVLSTQAVMEMAVSLGPALQRPLTRVPVQATRGAKPAARAGSRKRTARRGRKDAATLAVLGLVVGGLVLFPDQVMRTYMAVVTAVVTPVADQLLENTNDGGAAPPSPAP